MLLWRNELLIFKKMRAIIQNRLTETAASVLIWAPAKLYFALDRN